MHTFEPLYYGEPEDKLYGLYEPVGDLFLAVGADLRFLQDFALLFSSRYVLYVCDVSVAANYTPNIIDNTVCVNWSIGDRSSFPITRFPDPSRIVLVDSLIEKPKTPPWNYLNDQTYVSLAYYYLTNVVHDYADKAGNFDDRRFPQLLGPRGKYLKQRIESLPGVPLANRYAIAVEEIRHVLYTEFDVDSARLCLENIIARVANG